MVFRAAFLASAVAVLAIVASFRVSLEQLEGHRWTFLSASSERSQGHARGLLQRIVASVGTSADFANSLRAKAGAETPQNPPPPSAREPSVLSGTMGGSAGGVSNSALEVARADSDSGREFYYIQGSDTDLRHACIKTAGDSSLSLQADCPQKDKVVFDKTTGHFTDLAKKRCATLPKHNWLYKVKEHVGKKVHCFYDLDMVAMGHGFGTCLKFEKQSPGCQHVLLAPSNAKNVDPICLTNIQNTAAPPGKPLLSRYQGQSILGLWKSKEGIDGLDDDTATDSRFFLKPVDPKSKSVGLC